MTHDKTPHHEATVTGEVTELFAHRFVVATKAGPRLADLGPRGAEAVTLKRGDIVELVGEAKPSELKVRTITVGGRTIAIEHGRPDVDPAPALRTVAANGFRPIGAPRRKPKHFEILGRDAVGGFVEMHVELDGALRKCKPVHRDDAKWGSEIGALA